MLALQATKDWALGALFLLSLRISNGLRGVLSALCTHLTRDTGSSRSVAGARMVNKLKLYNRK